MSDVVARYLSALNAHDVAAVLACVTDDFVNEHTAAGGVDRIGKAAYAAALPGFLASFADLAYEPDTFIRDGARAAVPYRMSFRHLPSGGTPVSVRGVFVFTIAPGGLISRRVDHWDSGEVARQLAG
ncbi:nuclear transport factor 2 family protein [Kineosporia sp. J2-2]|uniref:Nuclear transport factor 2 family protein n=1 Tax=Kineosporia corallincola TaxID=2835133 RepID=A0ABS5TMX2_9ACTN|nr:nuclear transport factor 2 family protein [Kineosporia corallincola]MBT0772444.1 nuclear transport factor 2 family protein [Kineosporia corallincola]